MTVVSTVSENSYTGSGITGPYAYTYRIDQASDLAVIVADEDGAQTTLTYPGDYTVAGVGQRAGGTITLTTALASGWAMVVKRNLAIVQTRSIRNQGPTFPATIEDAIDYLTGVCQDLAGRVSRAFTVPETIPPSGASAEILNFTPHSFLRVNADGTGVEGVTEIVPTVDIGEVNTLRLTFDAGHHVDLVPSNVGALAFVPNTGEPIIIPTLLVGGTSMLSGPVRAGNTLRVESGVAPDTSGLTGNGITIWTSETDGAVLSAHDYDAAASTPLRVDTSHLHVKGVDGVDVGETGAFVATSTPQFVRVGKTIADTPGTNALQYTKLKLIIADDGTGNVFGFTVAQGDDKAALEYHTRNWGTHDAGIEYDSKHSFFINMRKQVMISTTSVNGETPLSVLDVTSGTVKRVKVGPAGSGPGGVGQALYI